MAKFSGEVGYAVDTEISSGIWEESIVEKHHYGDAIRNIRKNQQSGSIDDNIDISSDISIIADPFAISSVPRMRYVKWMGAKWKITSVEVQYPRIRITVGGIYNG